MPFSKFHLPKELLEGVRSMGWESPTPIQAAAIPLAAAGKDLMATSRTGSGKTAAFGLPLLKRMLDDHKPGPRSLVLAPTRELAAQVETILHDLARHTKLRTALLVGGEGFPKQLQALKHGAQVVVATPGRLLDHQRRGNVRLDHVEVLVLDEADRMLDMGFLPDIKRIVFSLPTQRQTLLFSATLAADVRELASFALREPERVELDPPTLPAEGISQVVYPVPQFQKARFLSHLLGQTQAQAILIFTRTKRGAERLYERLKGQGYGVEAMHADRSQAERNRALANFREGKTQILVATDVASRGIDVRHISHVINYDVPEHPEDYVHRVGRTARAGDVGDAITLCSTDEEKFLLQIERFVGKSFPRAALPDFEYDVPPVLTPRQPKTAVEAFSKGRRGRLKTRKGLW